MKEASQRELELGLLTPLVSSPKSDVLDEGPFLENK